MSASQLQVLVLGPTAVRSDGIDVAVERPLERALLVRLALAGGAGVPDERLAVDLWGEQPHERAAQRLRVVVSRLRSALAPVGRTVVRSPSGYRLAAVPADLRAAEADAERLHAAVRAADHRGVRTAALDALARWRGPALTDLRLVPFARAEGERLDDWHRDLITHRLRADLELGAAGEIVTELAQLASAHPLHEPIGGLLAHALYRAGRQAEALDHLARLRRALVSELGVDPSAATAELELRILRHDPTLLHPEPAVAAGPARPAVQVPESSFVGRSADLAALVERIGEPGIVTLVGGPGSGKSRLAVEAAALVDAAGERVVTLIELAPLRREDAVAGAVIDAAGTDPTGRLTAAAKALDGTLLVVDNAEHLVDEVSSVVLAVRAAAPRLTVLVTSQRPLLLTAEIRQQVGPLSKAAAAELFLARAVTADSAPGDVAKICAAVDRLPLGVELAAGLTRALSVAQLARRIDDRLRLLVGGGRDRGGRHPSLRAALDWSYELLAAPERVALRRAAVFEGGFDLDAAERVLAADPIAEGDIAPALTELVDRSLLTLAIGPDGSRRFGMLETIREYALAQLADAAETEATRTRHLRWCLEYVRGLGAADDFASADSVRTVFGEWPNLLTALDHAPGTSRAADGLRLANALNKPWFVRGAFVEARRHFTALADAPGAEPVERGWALSRHGLFELMSGRLDEAAELLDAAAAVADTVDDDALTLTVRFYQGVVATEQAKLTEAIAALHAGYVLADRAGLVPRAAAFADAEGRAHKFAGNADAAVSCARTAIAASRSVGDDHGVSVSLGNLANALLDAGQVAEALETAEEADRCAHALGDVQTLPFNEQTRAMAALLDGRLDEAERRCRAALAMYPDVVDSVGRITLADILIARHRPGDTSGLDEAAQMLKLADTEPNDGRIGWLAALPVTAALALAQGDPATARQVAAEAAAEYAASGFGWRHFVNRLRSVQDALLAPHAT